MSQEGTKTHSSFLDAVALHFLEQTVTDSMKNNSCLRTCLRDYPQNHPCNIHFSVLTQIYHHGRSKKKKHLKIYYSSNIKGFNEIFIKGVVKMVECFQSEMELKKN